MASYSDQVADVASTRGMPLRIFIEENKDRIPLLLQVTASLEEDIVAGKKYNKDFCFGVLQLYFHFFPSSLFALLGDSYMP